jgi:hypothetical protein
MNLAPFVRPRDDAPISVAAPKEKAPGSVWDWAFAPSIAALAAIGMIVRLVAAHGSLGNDEIWSLINLRPVQHFWQILWGISHDNNHFLNSLWLYFAWPLSEDATWLRLPSILAGTLAVPVMARLGARHGPIAAIAAATLTAFSFFQLTYSVQARGYATATLALVIAYGELERALDEPRSGARWTLALASGIGFFSHLAMGPLIALLGIIAVAETFRRRRNAALAMGETFALFWPTALAMAPTVAFVIAGYRNMGGFTIGHLTPFAASRTIGGIANMEMATFGLDPTSFQQAAFALVVLPLLVLAAIFYFGRPERRIAYLAMLVALPAGALLLRLPNTQVPRYFFAASPFLLLLAAESFGALWRFGDWRRAVAVAGLAATLIGDASAFARLEAGKAAPWTDALAMIAASSDKTLASSVDFNVGKSVDIFNATRGAGLDIIAPGEICARKPAWYILELAGAEARAANLAVEGDGCVIPFALVGAYDLNVPWQPAWALYRRAEPKM